MGIWLTRRNSQSFNDRGRRHSVRATHIETNNVTTLCGELTDIVCNLRKDIGR
jgi:hypothetical protein